VATRLLAALADPFVVGQRAVTISASVGIAALSEDEHAVGVEAVLAHADIAVYTAKRAGKGSFAVYDPLMTLPGTRALQLREPLRQALLEGSVEAYFQPIVELGSCLVTGFETLARWRHDGRYVEPDVFIPIAARSGLTSALTEHMLDLACAQLARWSAELGHRRLRTGVNVSPHSIGDPGLPDRVAQHMARHGIGPGQLVLEITEDALLRDLPTALIVTRRLRDLGVVLSLDDFGAGYSSLLHLRRIPLSSVKIDRGFAGDIDTNPETEQFMRALIAFGRDLGLRVIVEGVERPEQVEVLRRIGGTHAQGHLFGRPVPAEKVRLPESPPPPRVSWRA
jgi:predicted signal transduction protein with EAL and GGDEF domain